MMQIVFWSPCGRKKEAIMKWKKDAARLRSGPSNLGELTRAGMGRAIDCHPNSFQYPPTA